LSKTNETIARLDRFALSVGLALAERGNVRGFEYVPTRRWIEYRPGGLGVVKVTAYQFKGGPVEAEQHKTFDQMRNLLWRAKGTSGD
jgi:hypothetical protein